MVGFACSPVALGGCCCVSGTGGCGAAVTADAVVDDGCGATAVA